MYSMVLMVALSGGAEVPDWGRGGCHGCYGGCFGGCYGGCYGGCWGGCYGGGCYGYGCWGGCYGCYGGYGCWGSGYGCYGSGCWGGCYGSGYASWGCGGGYAWGGFPYGTGWGLANASPVLLTVPGQPVTVTQAAYYNPGNAPAAAAGAPAAGTPGSNRAALVVHLPASAKLTVDNTPTNATSDTRRFVTPPLEPGATYRYVLRAELDRNGEKVKASRNVEVRAGETSQVYLEFPGSERASK
jgi:uncharacterized protein (TIGR03000 family)